MPHSQPPLLRVADLSCYFPIRHGVVHALNNISFDVAAGEVLGVVGESGSGKSVAMMAMIGLLPENSADVQATEITFNNQNIMQLTKKQRQALRGKDIGFVFQDPMTSLNPVFTVGFQLCEPLRRHLKFSKKAARNRAAELLDLVGIPDAHRRLKDYPHQFSGGMRQRVMIAMALACEPKLLIADEPTTALDVTTQAQILELVEGLRKKMDMSIIWITHDLGVVAGIADRVMVMYGGQIIEKAPVQTLFRDPRHPYTRALLATLPSLTYVHGQKLNAIEGQPPVLMAPPQACSFAPRCGYCSDRCLQDNPTLQPVNQSIIPQLESEGPKREESISAGHDRACFRDFDPPPPAPVTEMGASL